eukprot:6392124-Amphidinium_carterae.1
MAATADMHSVSDDDKAGPWIDAVCEEVIGGEDGKMFATAAKHKQGKLKIRALKLLPTKRLEETLSDISVEGIDPKCIASIIEEKLHGKAAEKAPAASS